MQYRTLGKTDIRVSTVCLGGWSIVTEDFTWGRQDVQDSIAAVHASLDAGVNFFDTAEMYGNGESEQILARALAGRRKDAVIASKVSAENLAPEAIQKSCEQSLRRLKTDYIDLYQIHWPSPTANLPAALATLEKLREQGKIRAIGVSNFGCDYLSEILAAMWHGHPAHVSQEHLAPACRIETNQLPYSLLWRPIEVELQPQCVQHEVGILCYSPLCQGLLSGKFATADEVPSTRARTRLFGTSRPHARHKEAGAETETFAAIAEIRAICKNIGQPMDRVALAWLLARPGVTAVVAGARTPAQASANAAAGDLNLPTDIVEQLSRATDRVKKLMGRNCDPWQTPSRMQR